MVTCDICGKELKTNQGLRGHKNFIHSKSTKKKIAVIAEEPVSKLELAPSNTEPTPEERATKLEDRLQQLEQVTGLKACNFLNRLIDGAPLTEQLASTTRQLKSKLRY